MENLRDVTIHVRLTCEEYRLLVLHCRELAKTRQVERVAYSEVVRRAVRREVGADVP